MSKKFLSPVNLTHGATLPASGSAGDLFFKSDELKIYVHDGTAWVIAQGSGGGGGVTVSATAPADPTEGDYWFDSNTTKSYIYYDLFWVEVGNPGGGYIVSATAPTSPNVGDVWFSTTEGVIYLYYDGYWVDPTTGGAAGVPAGGTANQLLAKVNGSDYNTHWIDAPQSLPTGGTAGQILTKVDSTNGNATWADAGGSTTVSDTAPASPSVGDTWFNSTTGRYYTYYDSYWVEVGASVAGADGTNGVSPSAGKIIAMSIVFGG